MKTVKSKASLRLLTSSPTNSNSRPKKSPSTKARRNGARAVSARSTPAKPRRTEKSPTPPVAEPLRTGTVRAPSAALPTPLERDTLLTPLWVAESVVQEVERFLKAELPANWARRLAAKAHYLYRRHKHFHKGLNRPGNRGRENLLMFLRHWTAGWLRREHYALYKKLPWSFGNGQRLN
jgi:hypothetical protein